MHQVLHNKVKQIITILLSLTLILSGCSNKVETISIGEWLLEISNRLNIKDYSKDTPYFVNIDKSSIYYESIQSLVEWEVINTSSNINPDENLTREFVAYTLSNLYEDEVNAISIKDSSKSKYPKQVEKSVALGIMQLDSRDCFNPKQLIDKVEAFTILDKVVNNLNNKIYEDSIYKFDWKDDLILVEEPLEFDEENNVAYYSHNTDLNKGDIITWKQDDLDIFKKVEEIKDTETNKEVRLSDPDINEIYNELDIQDTYEVDFDNAIFEDVNNLDDSFEVDFNDVEIEEYLDPIDFINLSGTITKKQSNSFEINGFKVSYSTNGGSLKVKLNKVNTNGSIIYGEASLHSVKPTIKWNAKDKIINDAFFRLDFKTNSSLGLKKENYKNLYSDLSQISSTNFINSLINSFKEKEDILETVIPICKITVPIPSAPGLTLVMQLQVEIYTSGRIELSLSNTHSIGMQIKNNKMRIISNHDYNADFIVKASGNLMLGVYAGLKMVNKTLIDIGLSGGLKTELKSTVHIYDSKGNVKSKNVNLPTDYLDDLSKDNNDVKVCGDLKGYWVLDATINSSKSFANKLGISKKFNILNEKNAPLIPGINKHLENWHFVERCTVNDRYYALNKYLDVNIEKITINNYSKIININNSSNIEILSLPKGYNKEELSFTSLDSSIASVDSKGKVVGISKGNTIVNIKTMDNKYHVKCHILVKE